MSDDPPPEDFDYGDRLEDGQFENHPTKDEGEFVQPIRERYVHEECGTVTKMGLKIAESVARDPAQYGKTFCAGCQEYVSVGDVVWKEDGASWDMEGGDE